VSEELTSDIFFTIWENRKTLIQIHDFNAYIYKIAKFKALNYLREQKLIRMDLDEVSIELFTCTETTPEDDYISKEQIDFINEAIEQLPAKCKLAFKLVREDKLKYKEAAEHLHISTKTLEAHLTTAVKKIKEKLHFSN
jgi:RNA polymerase sigma-70 factor (ECF subfamily)